ncbi:uncharacterized protein KD926_003633 [Aspergillus affinis]|uniref:uncharacterized protein n=1 Tax=Aspergillus affinis TaxID=1070780 RepID=UPI0022FEE0B8|nr:uncharacterized protein KD926_003633 [Aspergillus affinis]KAI9043482.1 hypothetical protein KD926_003633 [Aspergillus affinis]
MNPHDHDSLFSSDPYEFYPFSQEPEGSSPADPSVPASHGRKRRRLSRSSAANPSLESDLEERDGETEPTTSIDLTESSGPSSLSKTLAKQQEDAIKAQKGSEHERGRSILKKAECRVCLDTPVDATTTACGHLFCHKCIMTALKSGEERADTSGKTPRGTCPICRKPLSRNDVPGARRNLVPLQFKLATRKRTSPQGQNP